MKLADQYCTREQALKLQELGVWQPKESEDWRAGDFYSVTINGARDGFILGYNEDAPYKMYNPIRLFSVAELGMMLPYKVNDDSFFPYSTVRDCGFNQSLKEDVIGFSCFRLAHKEEFIQTENLVSVTEAQARAELVICLIKEGKIDVEEVNKMLLADR